jgi:hypothetical protein
MVQYDWSTLIKIYRPTQIALGVKILSISFSICSIWIKSKKIINYGGIHSMKLRSSSFTCLSQFVSFGETKTHKKIIINDSGIHLLIWLCIIQCLYKLSYRYGNNYGDFITKLLILMYQLLWVNLCIFLKYVYQKI